MPALPYHRSPGASATTDAVHKHRVQTPEGWDTRVRGGDYYRRDKRGVSCSLQADWTEMKPANFLISPFQQTKLIMYSLNPILLE